MGRGGREKTRDAPERRCLVTGERGPTAPLIRFVLDPDGVVTPDLAEKLPGRGAWVAARREAIDLAVKKRLFNRGFKAQAVAPEGMSDQIEWLLTRRASESVSLCRKAGAAVAGFEKVKDLLLKAVWDGPEDAERAQGVILVQAFDGSMDGRRKLSRMVPPEAVLTPLSGSELGLAFGRPCVIHAALVEGGATKRAIRDLLRLAVFRADDAGADKPHSGGSGPRGSASGSSEQHRKHDA